MAIPTTPPYCEGGAPVGASEPPDDGFAISARAAASSRAWRWRSSAWSSAIWSLMDERSCSRSAIWDSISALWAARSATTCSWRLRAFSSSVSRCLISFRNLCTSPEDLRVLVRDPAGGLEPVQDLVEARRAEQDLDQVRAAVLVELDQAPFERALRGAEVGPRDLQPLLVDLLRGLDLVQFDLGRVVRLDDELEARRRAPGSGRVPGGPPPASTRSGEPGSPAPPAVTPPARGA